ncbi:MAG TPA: site-specific integrase [Terriglobia bacterium]|nr:site-specific integrase [Terriglobia bacterium]
MKTETPVLTMGKAAHRKEVPRQKGVFEKTPGSDVWWIRYADATGRIRREKAGTKGAANTLYHKRKTEALQGRKLPETLRRRVVLFRELCGDAVAYAREHHRNETILVVYGTEKVDYRAPLWLELFGNRQADSLTPQEIERELGRVARERGWAPASFNRYKAFVSLAYRLGIENDKVSVNPARLVHRRRVDNGRIRWLTADEETKLRAIIASRYPYELPAFELALHTGMRRSEQYSLTWDCVDLERLQLTIPRSKHGGIRYIPLDDTALRALLGLRERGNGAGRVMVLGKGGHGYSQGHALKTPREWFASARNLAGLSSFRWHDLRHTFASRLVMAGVGLRDVQELMGHKTIAMTCRYAHLAPSHQLAAIRRLDGWGQKQAIEENRSDTRTSTAVIEMGGAQVERSAKVVVQ